MYIYKKEFPNFGGYLVNIEKVTDFFQLRCFIWCFCSYWNLKQIADNNGGYIKLSRVERFILAVGAYEEKIFSKRADIREKKLRRILAEHRDAVSFRS